MNFTMLKLGSEPLGYSVDTVGFHAKDGSLIDNLTWIATLSFVVGKN